MSIVPRFFITFCFLLWNVLSSSTVAIHDDTILKIQSDSLNTALESRDNTKFFDLRRKRSAENGTDESFIILLNTYYNSLETQLQALQQSMDEKCESRVVDPISGKIIEAIQNHKFSAAQDLLWKTDYSNKIRKIVVDVYANSQVNVDVVLDFTKSLTNIELSFDVLNALQYEMQANGHHDPYKLIALSKTLDSEVINQEKTSPDIKTEAQKLSNKIIADINDGAIEILKTAMYTDNYQKNVQVEKLAHALFIFRSKVSDEVMQRLVNETYSKISATQIADNIYSHTYISQIISGLVALYNKLESNNDLNSSRLSAIKRYLGELQRMSNYRNIDEKKKIAVTKIMGS